MIRRGMDWNKMLRFTVPMHGEARYSFDYLTSTYDSVHGEVINNAITNLVHFPNRCSYIRIKKFPAAIIIVTGNFFILLKLLIIFHILIIKSDNFIHNIRARCSESKTFFNAGL